MTGLATHQTTEQLVRFLLVGGINTVLTGAIFVGLSSMIAPTLAYAIAFAIGIAFAAIVTPRAVFRAEASTIQRLRYVAWYLTVFAVGLILVYVLHDRLSRGSIEVAVVTFIATAGLSFIGARWLFERPRQGATSP